MLRDAVLETIPLAAESTAAGKLIRELPLRTRTGASIVGIERNGVERDQPGAGRRTAARRPRPAHRDRSPAGERARVALASLPPRRARPSP